MKKSPQFTDSRAEVMQKIRQQLGVLPGTRDQARAEAEAYLAAQSIGPQPRLSESAYAQFLTQTKRMSSTYAEINSLAEFPQAVAAYLAAQQLPNRATAWPEFRHLDWQAAGLELHYDAPRADDLVGITSVFAAIAETGTLALCSGPDSPSATSLLPETHIALVRSTQIVPYMEEVFARFQASSTASTSLGPENSHQPTLPRALSFISGPSRTGDIEQTIVLGAHGPYRLHVIILHE
ncbi:LutC/YkgG family protein [Parvibium lacunae]|uniref:Lactate utilization protein C n=1 Tax=Parvibium lacunae TaxID=1888893 RepID=A0A368L447_9BURK|nr:LUD domain-containing protein [Parvibium lacunae]RCS58295.1 lactate utilization protein C [Parvibium lacunae]